MTHARPPTSYAHHHQVSQDEQVESPMLYASADMYGNGNGYAENDHMSHGQFMSPALSSGMESMASVHTPLLIANPYISYPQRLQDGAPNNETYGNSSKQGQGAALLPTSILPHPYAASTSNNMSATSSAPSVIMFSYNHVSSSGGTEVGTSDVNEQVMASPTLPQYAFEHADLGAFGKLTLS